MTGQFRIEAKESFRVIGYKISTTNRKKEGTKVIPQHWESFHREQKSDQLFSFMNQQPQGLLGINVYNVDDTDAKKFDYYIAVASNQQPHDELSLYQVPACTWAIFPCTTETIGKTEVMAISKWLPKAKHKPLNSGYITGKMKSQAPDIEYYGQDGYAEVWIAIREK